jgi:cation-transporting ATPase E
MALHTNTAVHVTPRIEGLSEAEVLARRARGQGNDARLHSSRSYVQIMRENVFTFVNNVLFGLGIALALLGRVSDALVSVGVVMLNTIVSLVQEVRAKRVLDHIALLTRPKATVIREGQERLIDPGEIVLGDVLVVRPGDQVVVDGEVIGAGHMEVDESLLTGESDLIPKGPGDPVYSGSFCVTGSALYEAQKVGAESFATQITAGAQAFRRVYTPLQQQINLVIRIILVIAIYAEILLTVSAVIERTPIVESVQMSVVIAGLIPNGLFLAIAVAYAVGAVRMVRHGALVQQANAVESLSNVDVLCLDKTGTLTTNQITLHTVRAVGISEEELRRMLGDYAASTPAGNRTVEAVAEACPGQARNVREQVPFSSERKWSALVLEDTAMHGLYVLGAPEMLRPALRPLDDVLWAQVEEWIGRGLRVLLFATQAERLPLHDAEGRPRLPSGLLPLGVLSFSDELRPEARETLESFAEADIRIKIISGDNAKTVAALAQQVGLAPDARIVSGPDLDQMEDGEFARAAEDATIFGRITPRQKEQLVHALRNRGHYVAMIGDGVNDVLSLKKANLGIAMQSGSQATRSVADIVLLNDSFAAFPSAFREGQRILNGMQDILKLFMTRVLYVALLILSIGTIGGFPFTPKQSSLLALLTVGIPTIALAAWARPGRSRRGDLVRSLLHFVLPAVVTLTLVAFGVYVAYFVPAYTAALDANPAMNPNAAIASVLPVAQAALTTVTVLCGLLLIPFAEPPTRAWIGGDALSSDWRPLYLMLMLVLVYGVVLAVPALREFFDLMPLAAGDYALIGAIVVGWALALRAMWRSRLLERFISADL